MQVVQALHSCFLYDTVSFLDEARFHRLLPLIVSQLAAQPPSTVSALFAQQQTAGAAAPHSAVPGTDTFGDAVVSALVQMAISANNDAMWKTLNHQVLVTKVLALFMEVVWLVFRTAQFVACCQVCLFGQRSTLALCSSCTCIQSQETM